MGLFDRFRRKALTGTPEVLEALAARQLNPYPLLGGGQQQRIENAFFKAQNAGYVWMYASSPAVRTVIDLISTNVGQLDLRLFEEISESERQAKPKHPAALSVRYPNENTTSDLWVRQMVTDYLIFKNAYSLKFRNPSNGRLTFEYIPAGRMEVLGGQLFRPQGYRFRRDDGTRIEIPNPDDVFHWRDANPDDPRMGLSPLETLRGVIAEDAALETAIVELAKSGLVSPNWIFRPLDAPQWSNEARERFEEDLGNRVRRMFRGGSPPIMEEGMEIRDVGVSPRDGQILETRKQALTKVANLYNVPLAMVGLEGDLEQARSIFVADTLTPICEQFTRSLNLSVLVNEYSLTEYCFEFNLDEKWMGDDRLKALVSASGRPVLTTNESRAMINKPPIKGGDDLVTPDNVTAGDKPKPSVDVMPIQDPNKPSQDGDYREESGASIQYGGKALPVFGTDLDLAKTDEGFKLKAEQMQLLFPRFNGDRARQMRAVDRFAGDLATFYNRMHQMIGRKAHKASNRGAWINQLSEVLQDRVVRVVEAEGDLYVNRLAGDRFDMSQTEHYLKSMAEGAARGLVRKTLQEIKEDGLEEAMAHALGERLLLAASSLGAGCMRFARKTAAEQAPFPDRRMKIWVPDTERHANLGGVAVPLDGDWGGIEPGQPPNCQCTVSIQ